MGKSTAAFVLCLLVGVVSDAKSICIENNQHLICPSKMMQVYGRKIRYQVPMVPAPARGYPVVIVFQGTLTPVLFERTPESRFNTYYELKTIEALLNKGFAVIAPEAKYHSIWMTNVPGSYKRSSDFPFMKALMEDLKNGFFGPVDGKNVFAMGFSSGGYNTSRMAISFPGVFRALAIQSGSYATCVGFICSIPELPEDHPPTLFLHGGCDLLVPLVTMKKYEAKLRRNGVYTAISVQDEQGHGWNPEAADEVPAWFERFLVP